MLELIPLLIIVLIAGASGAWCFVRALRVQAADSARIADLERQLAQAQDDAAGARKQRAQALSRLSHELRTPMNGVLGFTEMLLASDLEDSHRLQVRMISESGRMMLRLLNDILDMTRVESGHFRLVEEPTDLAGELRTCVEMIEAGSGSHGTILRWTIDPALPQFVLLDRIRLREVLLNLVGNALKFTDQGAVHIEASLVDGRSKQELEIAVRDTGCGIPAERHEAIFEPFFDAGGSGPGPVAPTGLGLPIARQLVSRMGGELTLASMPGVGSTFSVRLPLVASTEHAKAPSPAALPPSAKHSRVLVAEDNTVNQQVILAMLECLGIRPDLVEDGSKAIDAIDCASSRGEPYSLVLMDIQMPQMDGLEATRHLRASGYPAQELPILALTANCFAEEVAACHEAGMQGHIGKPLKLSDLSESIAPFLADAIPSSPPGATPGACSSECDLRLTSLSSQPAFAALEEKYAGRKLQLCQRVDAILQQDAEQADWESLLRELHKVAGTAANFGDAPFGELSREISALVKSARNPAQRQVLLSQAYKRLKKVA